MPNSYPNTKCSNCGVEGETTQVMPYGQVCGYCVVLIGKGSFDAKEAKRQYNRQLKKAGVTQADLDFVRKIDRKIRKSLQ